MSDSAEQTLPRGVPYLLLASAVLLIAYLLTLGRVFTWDTLAYAGRLDGNPWMAERWPSTRFFNPEHLLYFVLAYPFRGAFQGLGIAENSIRVLQILSALLGAASAYLVGLILTRATGSPRRGLVGALGFGLSQATWHFSTSVGFAVPASFFLLLGLLLLNGNGALRRYIWAGVCLAAAALIHQVVALLALAVSVSCLAKGVGTPETPSRIRRVGAVALTVTWIALTLAAYIVVGFAFAGVETPGQFLQWAADDGQGGFFQPSVLASVISSRRPLADSFVSLGFSPEMEARVPGSGGFSYGLVIILLITLFLLVAVGSLLILRELRESSPMFPGILLGVFLMTVLIVATNPWNEANWYHVVPLGWLIIGFRIPRRIPPPPRALKIVAGLWLVLLGVTTLFGSVIPPRSAGHAHYGALLDFVKEHFEPGDILINGSVGPVVPGEFLHLAYFCNVDALRVPPSDVENRSEEFRRLVTEALERSPRTSPSVFVSHEAVVMLGDMGIEVDESRPVATFRGSRIYKLPPSATNALYPGRGD